MARFNAARYDPRQDSSPGTKALRSKGAEGVLLRVGGDKCACGCGQAIKHPARRFRQGHDARLRGVLTRAHVAGQPITLVGEDETRTTLAMTLATQHGMRHHLEAAARKASSKFVQPAQGITIGPAVGDVCRIKVGRWQYDATVLEVTEEAIVYEYPTQNGPRTISTSKS